MDDPVFLDQCKETVRESIRNGAELNVAFLLMNVLAATIACYGLFANSPAVVIGAMIVAMLLGPMQGLHCLWSTPIPNCSCRACSRCSLAP